MTQGCVSKSYHIRAMLFLKDKMFIITASIRVVYWNLYRNVSLNILFERIPNKANSLSVMYSSWLGLRPSPGAAILKYLLFICNFAKNVLSCRAAYFRKEL